MIGAPATAAGALIDLAVKRFDVVFARSGSAARIVAAFDGRRLSLSTIVAF